MFCLYIWFVCPAYKCSVKICIFVLFLLALGCVWNINFNIVSMFAAMWYVLLVVLCCCILQSSASLIVVSSSKCISKLSCCEVVIMMMPPPTRFLVTEASVQIYVAV